MNKILLRALLFMVIMIMTIPVYGFLYDYTFTATTSTYSEITGGTQLGTETSDDQRFVDPAVPAGGTVNTGVGLPLGFNFNFNDYIFDVIAINNNGWISFGQSALGATAVNITSSSGYNPLSSTSVITPPQLANRVAGFARDLQAQAGASLRMETLGTAPNRVCIIQWKNYKRYGTTGTGDVINFQIQLLETLNKVVLVYGTITAGNTTASTVQVGLRGTDATDFFNRTTTTDWTLTSAGLNNADNCAFSQTVFPPVNLTFEFNPPVPAVNDIQALAISGSQSPSVGAASNYTVTVRNRGSAAQTNYLVKLMQGTTELASVNGPAINSMEILDVVIAWTPATTGEIDINGKVVLAGDENSLNDVSPPLHLVVFPQGTLMVTIGNGTSTQRYPMGSLYGYERSASLYTLAELGTPGLITGIQYDASTQYGNVVPYRVLMKTTTATAFVTEPWATTIADAQLCAEGTITFDRIGWIYIPFSTPFMYSGDNLAVLVETNYGGTGTASSQYFRYTTSTTGSHHYLYADTAPPTTNGYLSASRPNIGISFQMTGMGSLSGLVSAGGNPLEGAEVAIQTTTLHQLTGTAGTYNFPYVQPGTYQVTCTKLGYVTQTQQAVITAGQATTLNFVMLPAPNVDVTGLVVGSDAPTVGLSEATVNLTGVINYTGTTNAAGQFTIPGVMAGNTYNYAITRAGYQAATGTITLGTVNYDMGTITLNELTNPPLNVHAELNTDQSAVLINWRAPGAAGPGNFFDFEFDNGGWVASALWNTAAHPNGDWEWTNTYNVALYDPTGSTYTQTPPQTCHSGTGMWGTVIYGAYTNVPTSDTGWSFLRKTFDLSGVSDPVLHLWHYMDGYNTWDYGLIKVNGTTVWGDAAAAVFMPWQEITADLSAFANQSNVEVSFEWKATTVVNYAGWYIDDVYIGPATGVPTRLADRQVPQVTPYGHNVSDRSLLGYKVWRLLQGQETNEAVWTLLTTTTITDTSYVNTAWQSLPDGEYKWAVKSVYTGDVMSVAAISNMVLKHAVVNVTGTVVGSDAPTTGLEGAEVSLTGMADYSAVTNAQGQFTIPNVYNLEDYAYTITKQGYTTATGTISVGIGNFNMGTITLNEIALPAGGVQAVEALPNVNITWMEPGTGGGEWIHWDSDTNDNSIGLTNGGTFDVASRWTVTDLTDFVGMSVYAVKFWPGDTGTYRIRVWTGGSATGPAQMVVDEPFTGYTIDAFNTFTLPVPVPIVAGQELWFGYNVTHAAGVYPAGTDAGPAHDGLGNMIYNNNAWTTLYTLSTSLNYDWNLSAYVGYSPPTAPARMAALQPLEMTAVPLNDGIFAALPESRHTESAPSDYRPGASRALVGYRVWRLLQGQEANEPVWSLLTPNTITATAYQDIGWNAVPDGMYKWAVKAVYTGNVFSVPAFSNAIQKLTQIGTIAGIVRQSNNVAIPNAVITAGTYTTTSNATGAYSLQVPAGTHTVTCAAAGFATATQTGVVVVTGQTTTLNFVLQPTGIVLDESFEGATFPPTGWTQIITETGPANTYGVTPTWCRVGTITLNPPVAPPDGAWQAAMWWSYNHQDEWLISPQFTCPNTAALTFKSYVQLGSTHDDHYYVKVSTDNGANWTPLWDATSQPGGAYNDYPNTPITIPLTAYANQDIKLAWHADDPPSADGMWFIWVLDDILVEGVVANPEPETPVVATALSGNYPNPFNPETTISYSVKDKQNVMLEIYNLKGQKVKTLVQEAKSAGTYQVKWDGTDDQAQRVTSGVYFYRMQAGDYTSVRKMIMLK